MKSWPIFVAGGWVCFAKLDQVPIQCRRAIQNYSALIPLSNSIVDTRSLLRELADSKALASVAVPEAEACAGASIEPEASLNEFRSRTTLIPTADIVPESLRSHAATPAPHSTAAVAASSEL